MKPTKLSKVSARDLLITVGPGIVIVALGFWFAYQFVKPAPPDTLVMTTGAEGGAYQTFAERYREILARDDITLELRASSGAVENLERLTDEKVDLGFVQSGIGAADDAPNLVSLGGLYYEPLWVFYRGSENLDRLTALGGKRIATGIQGSGTHKLVLQLLQANHVAEAPTQLRDIGGAAAAKALLQGEIDAAFFIAAPESALIQQLARDPGVRIMSFAQADAYARLFPFLSKIVLPQGAIDLGKNIPPRDLALVAATANLIATDELHPALIDLLVEAAIEVHGGEGLFHRTGEFPAPKVQDFPLSDEARRHYKSGRPFLQRYLPFWIATLVERVVVLLVPILALVIPLLRILPPLYQWRIRRKVFRWYGELKYLEDDWDRGHGASDAEHYLRRLDEIEQKVNQLAIPVGFSDLLYTLRQHIDYVRDKLVQRDPAMQAIAQGEAQTG